MLRSISLTFGAFVTTGLAAVTSYPSRSTSISPAWAALNATVGGRLFVGEPIAKSCFSSYEGNLVTPDTTQCSAVQAGYLSPTYLVSKYGSAMEAQWGTCISTHEQCLLDSKSPSNPLATTNATCDQGSISPYYIAVANAQDVQAAFAFASIKNIPLSIKNTGHDYMGRSHIAGSLALWMSYNAKFVPEGGGSGISYNAITVGAGVIFDDLYPFADAHNVTFVGGYAQSVGASGGYLMGGGHSVLSPAFGLAVDRVVQIKIVTPDGSYRTANKFKNADLFWALRGGGGGTFGVVIESTHRVEPALTLQVAAMTYTPSASNAREFFQIIVDNSVKWAHEGWGGHINDGSFVYVNPLISLADAQASMKPLSDYIASQNGTASVATMPSWYSFYSKLVVPHQGPVGALLAFGSRLIPQSVFEDVNGATSLVNILMVLRGIVVNVAAVAPTLYNATSANDTSVTPAWREAIWQLPTGFMWSYNSSVADVEFGLNFVHTFVDNFRAIAPNSGAYLNEAEPYETDYQNSFWGPTNYPKLEAIKAKYDPLSLLDCWKCVGTKADFPCYPDL
ncbi:hypothetical protein B0H10DRAFT_2166095 [Mycena sp. CBHHK59/15]|nr:hypothetical protein B0H10DRAFT_2166095 [Mycena sp. CBHHK59/15]